MDPDTKEEYFGNSHDTDLMEFATNELRDLMNGGSEHWEGSREGMLPTDYQGFQPQILVDHDDTIHFVEAEDIVVETNLSEDEKIFARRDNGNLKPNNVRTQPISFYLFPGDPNHVPGETMSKSTIVYRDEKLNGYVEALKDEIDGRFNTEIKLDEEFDRIIPEQRRRDYYERSTEVLYNPEF